MQLKIQHFHWLFRKANHQDFPLLKEKYNKLLNKSRFIPHINIVKIMIYLYLGFFHKMYNYLHDS